MPTNNPKISAYVPQHIFDRFKDFYEERQISMSQAVAVILSEYFGLDEQVNHDSKLPSGLLTDRLTTVEQKLTSLENHQSESISELLSELRSLTTRVSGLEQSLDSNNKIDSQSKAHSNQLSLLEADNQANYIEDAQSSELISSLLDEPLTESIPSSAPLPIQGKLLVLRLGTDRAGLSTRKKELSETGFSDWMQQRDIDHIRWINLGDPGKRSKGYVPADDTPSELLDRLRSWILENQDVKS